MSVDDYINKDICRNLHWSAQMDAFYPRDKNPYPFLDGKTLSEKELDDLIDGRLFVSEIKAHGDMLVGNLIRNGMTYFVDHRIPMAEYFGQVYFGSVVCTIGYKHRTTEALLCLDEVYFDAGTGEILQAIMSFR